MKTITKITTQKKNTNRFNIYLDEKYAFSVSEDIFIKHHLRKGLQLSEDDIEKITQTDSQHRYYVMAIHYLSYRMRSEREMRNYLIGKEIDPEVCNQIIIKLKEENLLNDQEFAKAFLHDRILQTSKGPLLIVKELREKGVSATVVDEVIGKYDYKQQFEKAFKWTEKQLHRKSNRSYQKQLEQLRVKLMQKGFSQEVIDDVLSEIKIDKDPKSEYAVLEVQADKLYRKYSKKHTGFELIQKLKAGLFRRGFEAELINKYVEKLDESM